MCSCEASTSSLRKDAARRDHAQRRPEFPHAAHLHRRSVGAQQQAVREPERVLHVARRMLRRNIQRVEVVIFGFDFRSVEHGEAERGEKVFDFLLELRDGMQTAGPDPRRRQRHVYPFTRQAAGQRSFFEAAFLDLIFAFEILLHRIQQLARARTFLGRKLSEFLADLSQRSFAPERLHARFFQPFRTACRRRNAARVALLSSSNCVSSMKVAVRNATAVVP